jgi:hypothetical protein
MLVSDVIDRINTAISDEDSTKATSSLFSNKRKVSQLKNALDVYASTTKGIEDIFSTPVNTSSRVVTGPTDAIRSEAYRLAYIWRDGRKNAMSFKDLNYVTTKFSYNTYAGIPRFFNVWNNEITIYPDNNNSAQTTTLDGAINDSATTITVASTNSFPDLNGRITINNEKIRYTAKTATTFTGCTRGIEGTTATGHSNADTVTHNNFVLHYRKKHFEISVDANDTISATDLAKEMEIPDEHIEPIIDLVAYRLLILIDDYNRADRYKIDASAFYRQAKNDIEAGYGDVMKAGMIGQPYDWEVNNIGSTI